MARCKPFDLRLLALPMVLVAGCALPDFAVEASYAELAAEGDLSVTNDGQSVVQNSLDDMGVGGDEGAVGLRADFKWGMPHLSVSTVGGEWSGNGRVTEFGDITDADVDVTSSADLSFHNALLTFDVLPGSTFELGFGVGVAVIDVDARVTETATQTAEETDELLPLPVLAVRAMLDVWRLQFEGLLSGMTLSYDGDEATYLDLDLAARFRFVGLGPIDGHLSVGYRYIDIELEYEDDGKETDVDVLVDGLYVGLRISF